MECVAGHDGDEKVSGHQGDGDPVCALIVTAGHNGDGGPPGFYDARYPAMMATFSPEPLREICIFSGEGNRP